MSKNNYTIILMLRTFTTDLEYLKYNKELKEIYGEINTPFSLVKPMVELLNDNFYTNKELKILDPGTGHGNFSIFIFFKLMKKLETIISNEDDRKKHIIKNIIHMIDVNETNVCYLREKFGNDSNIVFNDFINHKYNCKFDLVIGNPPFNCNGIKKVPTENNKNKKEDGKTIWHSFIKKSISLLKNDGKLIMIIPSIWLKPDKAKMYEYMLQYDIEYLTCLDSSEVNNLFNYHVQTPCCYFLLHKRENTNKINIFDHIYKKYVNFTLYKNIPIPLKFPSIVNKFLIMVRKYGHIQVVKTNPLNSKIKLFDNFSQEHEKINIQTCKLAKDKTPYLSFKYSYDNLPYSNTPKLIMAHKMYGFPYYDASGVYGISSRDNYLIINKTHDEFLLLKHFLSNELILFVFETTRYRMRYLEKYAFEYIPDFTKIHNIDFKTNIYKLFDITNEERKYINKYFKVKYRFFS